MLKIAETVTGITYQYLEGLFLDSQTLKNILISLCLIPPDTSLRLVLQLALASSIPKHKQDALFAQLKSNRSLESLLIEAEILRQILEADGKLGEAEENMLFEAMEFTGLVVPTNFLGARLLLEELSQNLVQEICMKQYLEGLFLDYQTLKNILISLCLIPPDTSLRLVLQLALASSIPKHKQDAIFTQLKSNRSLESLLIEAEILRQILEADGKLGEAEENMLLEAIEFTGLVVPTNFLGAQLLLEKLSKNLVQEMCIYD